MTDGFAIETSRGDDPAGRVVHRRRRRHRSACGAFGLAVPASAEPLHMNITEATEPMIHHMVQHADRQIT